jgi:hypothetical protein
MLHTCAAQIGAQVNSPEEGDVVRFSQTSMNKVGAQIIDRFEDSVRLRCRVCNKEWIFLIGENGRLPRGYWHCPNKCNAKNEAQSLAPSIIREPNQ